MLLQPIATQLRDTVTDLRKVSGAANFAAAREDLKLPPAAYLIPLAGNAQPNRLIGRNISQHVPERFGVILAVSNLRDVRGDAVNAALEDLRNQSIQALLGFQASAAYDPIQLGPEALLMLDTDRNVLWWQIIFSTGYYERKVV